MKYLLLILLFSQNVFALTPLELSDEEINPDTQEVLIKKPEKYLRDDSMIYDLNTDLGIRDQRKNTGTDHNRFAVAGHVSSDYERANDLLGLELNYMHKSDTYNQLWYGAQFFQNRTYFDAITQNKAVTGNDNPHSDSQYQRPNHVKTTIMAGGLGVGYRFKLLLEFLQTEDVFETVDVFVNYLSMNESFLAQKYQGYGLTTNYGIHKRVNSKYFYGGKISYNIATVTRAPLGSESKSDRTFSIGWLSLAFEMGLFF